MPYAPDYLRVGSLVPNSLTASASGTPALITGGDMATSAAFASTDMTMPLPTPTPTPMPAPMPTDPGSTIGSAVQGAASGIFGALLPSGWSDSLDRIGFFLLGLLIVAFGLFALLKD